ncbi:MAG: glycosyltransferase family 4 protein [Verrucomicrobiota bacterium]|jgi:glycosyltransferase involved in cell wall biosynthesis
MLVVLTNIPTPYRTAFFDALAEEAARAGKRFHVLYCAKTEPGRHWPYDASKIRHAHAVLRGFHPSCLGIHAHLNPGVLAELNLLKPDTLILAGSWNTPTMLIAGLNIYSPPPRRFFWSEGHADAVLHKSGLIAWLRRRMYRTFDGFAVPNAKSAEWALAQAGGPRPIVTLPNAIDAQFFARPSGARDEARRALGLEGEGRVLVQVSALTERKGVMELAKAFLALPPENRRGAKLVFVGEGELRPQLEALAAESAGAIRVLGQLPPEEVRRVLWASDAFVLNTRLDPNPLSAIEAAAAGLPVVMSAAAGNIHEVVEDPKTGFVIRDISDPSDALRAVLAASDAQLAEMGTRAVELARTHFDAPAVARSLIAQLYP